MAQVIENLPSKHKALSSNPSVAKIKITITIMIIIKKSQVASQREFCQSQTYLSVGSERPRGAQKE
jgi:hypothetical protein